MKRREFAVFVGGAALGWPLAALAQQSGKVARIGLLISEPLAGQAARVETLRAGLRERGYVEGRDIAFELRSAEGNYERLPELAAELARLKVDVMVSFGSKATVAAHGATQTVPIVVPLIGDPVGLGLVGSLSRPGGNITGIAVLSPQIGAKRVELLKQAIPRLRRVALLQNPANASSDLMLKAYHSTGDPLKLELRPFEARTPKDFAGAFAAMAKARMEAVAVSVDTLFRANIAAVTALAANYRLPTAGAPEFADAGCLIGYGAVDAEMYRRGAYFVDRILKGAKPADLPVEQPTRFELAINLKTAKALGIAIPPALRLRADRVIE
jgi:putative ABC transport system substrate-binding protein